MTTDDFSYVCQLVRERCAIVLETGKEYLVDTRLTPVIRDLGMDSISTLVGRLRKSPEPKLIGRVIEAMVTTETSFFRDNHPFEDFRTAVIPDLISKRQAERRLDIWCGASSTGQEPYSLAILLRERFPQLATWTINFLATDISTDVLDKARSGVYSQLEVNRGLPATLLVKYFKQQGTGWVLREDVRNSIEFRELNLAKPWPMIPRVDLVCLRNVMIYFDIDTKKSILSRIGRLLRPDGYLLLGGAETTMNLDESFQRCPRTKAGFYQLVK